LLDSPSSPNPIELLNPMDTQIARNGVVIGTFQLKALPDAIASGSILSDDYAWHEGLTSWTSVSELCASRIEGEGRFKRSVSSDHRENDVPQFDPTNGEWRDKPITSPQVKHLKSFGITTNRKMKRGEAYDLINQCKRDPKSLNFQAELRRKNREDGDRQWAAAEEAARKNRAALGAFALRVDVDKAKLEIETWKAEKASNSLLYRAKKKELAQLQKKLADADEEQREDALNEIEDLEGEIEGLDPITNPDPQDLSDWKEELKEHEDCRIQFWKATFGDDWPESGDRYDLLDFADTIIRLYSNYGLNFKPPTKKMIRDVLDALDSKSTDWDKVTPELFFGALSERHPCGTQTLPPIPSVSPQPKLKIENRIVAKPRQASAARPHPKPAIANPPAKGCLGIVISLGVGTFVFGAVVLLF